MQEPLSPRMEIEATEVDYPQQKKRLAEYATEKPLWVLHEVFRTESPAGLQACCLDWFHTALVSESSYVEEEQRQALWQLYEALPPLLEALFLIHGRTLPKLPDSTGNNITPGATTWLSREQFTSPFPVVMAFCRQFTPEYVRRQLWDWLTAATAYGGTYPESLNESRLLVLYDHILCLTSVAFELVNRFDAGRD